jgi:predicted RNA-binding Zn ribbon-like protein
MRPAGYAMTETAGEKNRRKRKYHTTAESIGKRLVMAELLRRGFEAELAGSSYKNHDMLVWVRDSPPKPIRIKTVHSPPWYVRRASFAKRSDQATVYVLLGAEASTAARFFVVKNSDLAAEFRQPPTWKAFGFIDAKSVEKYEDNWDILR